MKSRTRPKLNFLDLRFLPKNWPSSQQSSIAYLCPTSSVCLRWYIHLLWLSEDKLLTLIFFISRGEWWDFSIGEKYFYFTHREILITEKLKALGIYSYTFKSVILESVKIKIFSKSVKMIQIIIISEKIRKWHFWKCHSWKCQNRKCRSRCPLPICVYFILGTTW